MTARIVLRPFLHHFTLEMMTTCRLALIVLLMSVSGWARGQGTVMLAGGGREGDIGDTTAWSYALYQSLVANGDIDGDGTIRIAVLTDDHSAASNPSFIPRYFEWIGATLGTSVESFTLEVADRAEAEDPSVVDALATADGAFIKGGDQGAYYDAWDDTRLEQHLRDLADRGGAFGGTSAGAMSAAGVCLCGERDLISSDPMADAHTAYLDDADTPGTSGLHADFLSVLPGTLIDTHFTERGRLGRLIGSLAKVNDDRDADLLGIGVETSTGLVIRGGVAEVRGEGTVSFLRETPATQRIREPGQPLVATHLRLDRLTAGWRFDLAARRPLTEAAPSGVVTVDPPGAGAENQGALTIRGRQASDRRRFAHVASYHPDPYRLRDTSADVFVREAVGFTDVDRTDDHRGDRQATLFRALFDAPESSGFLLFGPHGSISTTGTRLSRTASVPDELTAGGDMAAIIVDGSTVTHKGLAPAPNFYGLRSAALVNATVHVLAESARHDLAYNSRTRSLVPHAPAVTFDSTAATVAGDAVTLRWTARPLAEGGAFIVQQRSDSGDWGQIGRVAADPPTEGAQRYTFRVEGGPEGAAFRLKYIGGEERIVYSDTIETAGLEDAYRLTAPVPNPFQDRAEMTLRVAETQRVRIDVFDVLGRRIATLHDGQVEAGRAHSIELQATNWASGVYIIRVVGDRFTAERTAVRVR